MYFKIVQLKKKNNYIGSPGYSTQEAEEGSHLKFKKQGKEILFKYPTGSTLCGKFIYLQNFNLLRNIPYLVI